MNSLDLGYLRSQIIGINHKIDTPFGRRLITYADYTASGRGLEFVENYLIELEALYANSHTEDDTTGRVTTQLLHQAEAIIKRAVNAGEEGRIIACGTGATAAIDRMQQLVGVKLSAVTRLNLESLLSGFLGPVRRQDFQQYLSEKQPVVFVGPYEHHSNEISWREGLATVIEVRLSDDGEIDLGHLEELLQLPEYQGRLRIGSFSAASNVTGMRTPVHEVARLLHRYDAWAFFDYAACAPYVEIDMAPQDDPDAALDAVFISPHKFLGGPGASGVLVFNTRCYQPDIAPSVAGGGTVDYVGMHGHDFIPDIEVRENAGTPGILQILKAALAFEVKSAVGVECIEQREHKMTALAFERWSAHPQIDILGNLDPAKRISIISFNIRGDSGQYLHPKFITTLLDDLFGIQSRAGCSCAGPYGHRLLGIAADQADQYREWIHKGFNGIKPGWCRLGFHYVFDDAEVEFIIRAVEFVASHGHLFSVLYQFDPYTGTWRHKKAVEQRLSLSLDAALRPDKQDAEVISTEARSQLYEDYFAQAGQWIEVLRQYSGQEEVLIDSALEGLQFFELRQANLDVD
ncbi:MAG: aminotransferase class V-fold PLP-dependent enzyme [Chromatiales bacterium]|nr:aminotransferase class V-fold PLP-dependent enzyme [Chromatiales bacterium]